MKIFEHCECDIWLMPVPMDEIAATRERDAS